MGKMGHAAHARMHFFYLESIIKEVHSLSPPRVVRLFPQKSCIPASHVHWKPDIAALPNVRGGKLPDF